MIRFVSASLALVTAFFASSCCCTSDVKPAELRPLPQFREIHTAPEVDYSK